MRPSRTGVLAFTFAVLVGVGAALAADDGSQAPAAGVGLLPAANQQDRAKAESRLSALRSPAMDADRARSAVGSRYAVGEVRSARAGNGLRTFLVSDTTGFCHVLTPVGAPVSATCFSNGMAIDELVARGSWSETGLPEGGALFTILVPDGTAEAAVEMADGTSQEIVIANNVGAIEASNKRPLSISWTLPSGEVRKVGLGS